MTKKNNILGGYKTYDPEKEGYGNKQQWRSTFNHRFFSDFIEDQLKESGLPWDILGVDRNASKDEIRKAYYRMALKHHPDKGGTDEMMKKVNEAYEKMK